MILSNKVYNILKWVVLVCLPACILAWSQIAAIYHLDDAHQVTDTLSVINVLLGTLTGVSGAVYNKQVTNNTKEDENNG